jgi:hypothetical protein
MFQGGRKNGHVMVKEGKVGGKRSKSWQKGKSEKGGNYEG